MSLYKKYSYTRSATSNGMKIHKHLKVEQCGLFTVTFNVSYPEPQILSGFGYGTRHGRLNIE